MNGKCNCILNESLSKICKRYSEDVDIGIFTENDESCCMLSFIVFLCFFCKDTNGLVRDLRKIITKAQKEE